MRWPCSRRLFRLLCDKEWMILCGGDVWATEVAHTICRAAAAKGTAINPALPLPFDKLINGRVNRQSEK